MPVDRSIRMLFYHCTGTPCAHTISKAIRSSNHYRRPQPDNSPPCSRQSANIYISVASWNNTLRCKSNESYSRIRRNNISNALHKDQTPNDIWCITGASGWFYCKETCYDARSHVTMDAHVTMHGHMSRCTVTCHGARSHERKIREKKCIMGRHNKCSYEKNIMKNCDIEF